MEIGLDIFAVIYVTKKGGLEKMASRSVHEGDLEKTDKKQKGAVEIDDERKPSASHFVYPHPTNLR